MEGGGVELLGERLVTLVDSSTSMTRAGRVITSGRCAGSTRTRSAVSGRWWAERGVPGADRLRRDGRPPSRALLADARRACGMLTAPSNLQRRFARTSSFGASTISVNKTTLDEHRVMVARSAGATSRSTPPVAPCPGGSSHVNEAEIVASVATRETCRACGSAALDRRSWTSATSATPATFSRPGASSLAGAAASAPARPLRCVATPRLVRPPPAPAHRARIAALPLVLVPQRDQPDDDREPARDRTAGGRGGRRPAPRRSRPRHRLQRWHAARRVCRRRRA